MYAIRDSANAAKALRLEALCEGGEFPRFWYPWWSLRGQGGYSGVPGRPCWVLGGSLGVSGMSLERLGVSGRSLGGPREVPGFPQGPIRNH